MTNVFFKRDLSRWVFAVVGVIVTFYVMSYFAALILLFTNMLPSTLSVLLAGFPLGLLVVLAGSLLAPRYQIKIALFLWALCVVLTASGLGQATSIWLSTLAGGGVAVVFVAWWISPMRSPRATRRVTIGVGAALLAVIGFVQACLMDIPARPDMLTPQLLQALGSNGAGVEAFYSYSLAVLLTVRVCGVSMQIRR